MGSFVAGTKVYVLSGLEQADYNLPGWVHVFNRNFELLNAKLLNVEGMIDVDDRYLPDNGVLVYRSGAPSPLKWRVRRF
jgi:hypothetical protein